MLFALLIFGPWLLFVVGHLTFDVGECSSTVCVSVSACCLPLRVSPCNEVCSRMANEMTKASFVGSNIDGLYYGCVCMRECVAACLVGWLTGCFGSLMMTTITVKISDNDNCCNDNTIANDYYDEEDDYDDDDVVVVERLKTKTSFAGNEKNF